MNPVAFKVGQISVLWYSIFIGIGMLIGYVIIHRELKRKKLNVDVIDNLIFLNIIFGILGARIYYVIFNYEYYLNNIFEIFVMSNGGLAIHGAIITGVIVTHNYCKKKKLSFFTILDVFTPALVIGQAIGRWGNFFNQEAYGRPVLKSVLNKQLLPSFVIDGMNINGIYYQPTFFYESIACFLIFFLILIIRKTYKYKPGFIFGIYLVLYGFIRFFIERLRQDSLMFFGLKAAQIISIIMIAVGILLIYISKKGKQNNEKKL